MSGPALCGCPPWRCEHHRGVACKAEFGRAVTEDIAAQIVEWREPLSAAPRGEAHKQESPAVQSGEGER